MQDLFKKYGYFLFVVIVLVGIFFIVRKEPTLTPETPVINNETITITPSDDSENEEKAIEKPVINAVDSTYKQLITKGHEVYLAGKYPEALSYFKQAVLLQKNDRIYRSIYSAYLALKDYKNAEIAILNSLRFNSAIPNNWLEYAYFKNYYMNAPFETVSLVYTEALKATKDNINVVTAYASYLAESKKYTEAISYLEKAIVIDPARKAVFQAEIDYLRTRQ